MVIEKVEGYSSFNKMVNDYSNIISTYFKDVHILAHPSDSGEGGTNILFISPKYTVGIWATSQKITVSDIGTKCLKLTHSVLDIKEVSSLEYDENHVKITFKEDYKVKEIFLDLNNISNSKEI